MYHVHKYVESRKSLTPHDGGSSLCFSVSPPEADACQVLLLLFKVTSRRYSAYMCVMYLIEAAEICTELFLDLRGSKHSLRHVSICFVREKRDHMNYWSMGLLYLKRQHRYPSYLEGYYLYAGALPVVDASGTVRNWGPDQLGTDAMPVDGIVER